MKKLITILILLFSLSIYAQDRQILSIGINPKIVFDGAYSYSDKGDFSATLSWVNKFDRSNIESGISLEYTKLEPYYFTTGFIGNFPVRIFDSCKIETLIGLEVLYLQRGKVNPDSQQEFLTAGLNAYFRWYLVDTLAINLRLNGKLRPDTVKLYNGQKTSWGGFIELSYIFY